MSCPSVASVMPRCTLIATVLGVLVACRLLIDLRMRIHACLAHAALVGGVHATALSRCCTKAIVLLAPAIVCFCISSAIAALTRGDALIAIRLPILNTVLVGNLLRRITLALLTSLVIASMIHILHVVLWVMASLMCAVTETLLAAV
eukprot:CAMPEP_0169391116 /NCGR_PEP_ID=MMETSP1017-20121227/47800_1 /TAXON_ID=342587 /ORGANISM="Karlodinium micrum, Strain CCMP2283" /LENGTH=146 /DNA_ID=CAMNT_0009493741 /DNA_START=201 /DNA_END=641 /DNA_ORIENTATION=+